MPNSPESAEDRLIARYFRPLAKHPGAFGLVDDAAVIAPPPGCDVVLTTDGVIVGVHVFPDDRPENIGRKALRMNLSDLAAKGATPLGFLLSLALPAAIDEAWLAAFAGGLGEDAERYDCPLLGGDTDRTPGPTSVSIAAFGAVPHGKMVRRSTAKPGDHIIVTGTIGDAALGVLLRRDQNLAKRWRLSDAMSTHLKQRYLLPEPRNALAMRFCKTLRRQSMCPTVSPAISPSCAARPALRPRSMSRACRFPMRSARQSPPIRR